MNMLLPTQGAWNEHVESLHKTKSALSWGLSVFPLTKKGCPQTEVHSMAISFAAQLPQISICHCIFWDFLIAFLQRQGLILAEKRTKKDVLVGSSLATCGFASQVAHTRLASG